MPGALSSIFSTVPVNGIVCSFLVTVLLVPLLRSLFRRSTRFADVIPPVGGVVFLASAGAALLLEGHAIPTYATVGILSVFAIGVFDDMSARSARGKTLLLLLAIGLSVWLGEHRWLPHVVPDKILHLLWLIWMCNAFNVFDAVDGLSSGVGVIVLLTFGGVNTALGFETAAVVCFVLAASLVGYLIYNFHPAKVYMGDAGSLLLGFVIGEMAWMLASRTGGVEGVGASLLIVGVFCFEAVFLILIRIAKVTMPTRATYDHPTQRLIASGCSVRGAVARTYVMTGALCLAGVICLNAEPATALFTVGVGVAALIVTGILLGRVDTIGDGCDGRPGSVFTKHWLVNRIVHKAMLDLRDRAHGVMLDLGCGRRPYERIFRDRVDRYFGMDVDPGRYGGDGIDVVSSSEVVPVASNSVDTVLSNQVLEHLREPGDAVREMARILKPGGVAIITAPHIWGIHEEPHDYYRFTPYGLRYLAEGAGLRVERVDALAGYWVTTGARLCYYLERFDRGPLRPFIRLAYYTIQAKCFVMDHLHRVEGDAWNHLMIAVKDVPERDVEGGR